MSRSRPALRLAAALAAGVLVATPLGAQPDRPEPVRVTGTVRRLDTGEALRHAVLEVDGVRRSESNADGVYFLRVPPGERRLRVRAVGYAPLDTVLTLAPGAPRTVDLALRRGTVTLARTTVVARTERPAGDPSAPESGVARLDLVALRNAAAVLGEVDPVRSLTLLPGVSRASDFSTGFNVRGGGSDQNLVRLDDATLYNPSHALGLLSVFNADAVDEVTLHKGAIPARFGGRLSSVLDVRQREGSDRDFRGRASVGLLASRLSYEGPLPGRRGSFLVAGRRSYADLFLRASNDPEVRDDVAYFYDLNAKLTRPVGHAGALTLSGYLGRDRFASSQALAAGWGNRSATLRWTQVLGARLFTRTTVAASEYDYGLDFRLGADSARWTAGIRGVEGAVDAALHLRDGSVVEFGAQGALQRFRPGDVTPAGRSALTPLRVAPRRTAAPAAYADHELELGRLAVRYGVRLSGFARYGPGPVYRYANAQPVQYDAALGRYAPGIVVDSVGHARGARVARYDGVEPRASVRLALTPTSSLKAGYARTYQYLHQATRTNEATPLDVWEPAGPYLRPASADQLSLGWFGAADGGRWELSAEGYARRLRDVLDFIDGADLILNPRIETLAVQGVGRAAGLELFAHRRTGAVTGWVSYTLARSRVRVPPFLRDDPGLEGGRWYPAPFDKTHELSVVAQRPMGRGWTAGATFAFATGLPATYPEARYAVDGLLVAEFGGRNARRLPPYHRLDLALTRATRGGELQLGVVNAYNRFNAQAISFRQSRADPLRAEAVQLSVFGLVPSVSYAFRF